MAQIVSIVYQPAGHPDTRRPDRFVRVPVTTATLVAGLGIEGDAKAGRHPQRQLNLLSAEWLAARRQEDYKTQPGEFGEQLIIEGLAVETLQAGQWLQLGEHAWIEITKPRAGCAKLQAIQEIATPATGESIGMLAKVLISGTIRVGDPVTLVAHSHDLTLASVIPNTLPDSLEGVVSARN
jgi:MOSC domain-containing protein YiiM